MKHHLATRKPPSVARFSRKQIKVLSWWVSVSPMSGMNGVIADGAIRSGKTFSMAMSFILWAMSSFDNQAFAMCGHTISSFRRNVLRALLPILQHRGYALREYRTENLITIRYGGRENYFYIFGGQNESSQDLIQGMTLAGVFFDEVALMPESFVNQATGRCSVEKSKFWFNCNPRGPFHYFKTGWIDKAQEKRLFYVHFTMEDNPSLSKAMRQRYREMYAGVFYNRYIRGLWELADGAIYDMWDDCANLFDLGDLPEKRRHNWQRYIAVDYGTSNPMVFLDALFDGESIWICNEYYYDSRQTKRQKTDTEYADDFETFAAGESEVQVILDPSASSFKTELRKRGYRIRDADNHVLDGIRVTSTMILQRKLRVERTRTPELQKERAGYIWNEKAAGRGEELPLKERDHAMDAMRYLVKTIYKKTR